MNPGGGTPGGQRPGRAGPAGGAWPRALAPLLTASVISASILSACGPDTSSVHEVRRISHDLLASPQSWRVLSAPAHADGAAAGDQDNAPGASPGVVPVVITPDVEYATDSGDRAALALSPPCEVELTIPADAGSAALVLFAGVDLRVARRLGRLAARDQEAEETGADRAPRYLDIIFEVEHNGIPVSSETVRTHAKRARDSAQEERAKHRWHAASGTADGRLPVRAGDRVLLRTRYGPETSADAIRFATEKAAPLAGFGPLLLEEVRSQAVQRATREHPNILFLVMDTQRLDRTDLMPRPSPQSGSDQPIQLTPRLAQLGRRGTIFENARASSSWTWPSTASLLTGRLPADHRVTNYTHCTLSHGLKTLAEVLEDTGYTTAAFSANPLISAGRQFDQGFGTFRSVNEFMRGDTLLPDIFTWLEQHGDERFFLYIHLADPHSPHEPLPQDLERLCGTRTTPYPARMIAALGTQLRAKAPPQPAAAARAYTQADPSSIVSTEQAQWLDKVYNASVATGDRWVGALLDELEALGLTEDTVIAYTSDHGEELLDHGLFEHAHTLHDELLRVPLVLAGPGLASGRRVATPVSNRHLAPTLARLAGADAPDSGLATDGLDLTALAQTAAPVFFETHKGWWNGRQFVTIHGVLAGDFILHWAPTGLPWEASSGSDPGPGQLRLYQRLDDPLQTQNLAATQPERARELQALIRARLAFDGEQAAGRSAGHGATGAGAGTLEMLRAVGYAGEADGLREDGR